MTEYTKEFFMQCGRKGGLKSGGKPGVIVKLWAIETEDTGKHVLEYPHKEGVAQRKLTATTGTKAELAAMSPHKLSAYLKSLDLAYLTPAYDNVKEVPRVIAKKKFIIAMLQWHRSLKYV